MIFDALTYAKLAEVMFHPRWPGLPRDTKEAPNGDGNVDIDKRYSHAAMKYFRDIDVTSPQSQFVVGCWRAAFERACVVAIEYGLPLPSTEDSTLRILDYPPGAKGHKHTDFDLFTINCFRNRANEGLPAGEVHWGEIAGMYGPNCAATEHDIHPDDAHQYSIVFFAMPSLDLMLPNGQLCRDWRTETKKDRRVQA